MITFLRKHFTGLFLPVAGAVILADLFVIALAALSLQASYEQYFTRAATSSRNMARLIAASVEHQLSRIDLGLLTVQDEYARQVSAGGVNKSELTKFLKTQFARLPQAAGLRISDADGTIVYGADEILPAGVSAADRDYFLAMRNGHNGLFISQPVLSRISQKWVINVARRLSGPNGSFAGVVYGQVALEWFTQEFSKLELGARGGIALRGDASSGFRIFARYPDLGYSGDAKRISPQLPAMVAANPQSGTYEAYSGPDRVRRIHSYQAVGDYPLMMVVALSTEDIFAGWRRDVQRLGALAGVYLLLSALGGWLVLRALNARSLAYRELHQYKDQLETVVEQRTSELLIARDAAEAANKAKSVFLANMSHELRTPLNAILGFSGLMRLEPDTTNSQRDKLDIINRSGEHLLTLINDVLEMAKIEAGRLQLDIAPLDLGGMVRDVADMMRLRAQEKGIQLVLDQSSRFPRYIKGDEARLRQILVNLVGNAVKFTAKGCVTIRLRTKTNAREHLIMEVEDTGPGIAPEDQERLFQPFIQLARSDLQKGTGLGLAISRQFAELMGGKLWVESTLGKGTIFRIDLPVTLAGEKDIAALQQTSTPPRDVCGLAPGQPAWRILITEDQRENQMLLIQLMENLGIETRLAENGAESVQIFQEWHPHLIWMDRRMAVMDGVEATRRIRALPDGKEVRIVAVTASVFGERRQELFDAGMNAFVHKPYRFHEIYDCMAEQLGVRYIYKDAVDGQGAHAVLTPEMLAVLPEALRDRLHKVLETLDSDEIMTAIRDAGEGNAELAHALVLLAEDFNYVSILTALDAVEKLKGAVHDEMKLEKRADHVA